MSNSSYKQLSALSFDKRSEDEQGVALLRPNLPEKSFEAAKIAKQIEQTGRPFYVDLEHLKEAIARLGDDSQLVASSDPHFRNRLTHTLHVAEVAEKICAAMGLDSNSSDLARAIAYAHDSGHAPFSHEAEVVFTRKLAPYGAKWDHAMFGVEFLNKYAVGGLTFRGLPLTVATMEGALKHHLRYDRIPENAPELVANLEREKGYFNLGKWNGIEGQIVAASDWLAHTVSDIKDLLLEKLGDQEESNLVITQPTSSTLFEQVTSFIKGLMGIPTVRQSQIASHEKPIQKTQADRELALKTQFEKIFKAFPLAEQAYKNVVHNIRSTIKGENGEKNFELPKDYYLRMTGLIEAFSSELQSMLIDELLDETLKRYNANSHSIKIAEDVRNLDTLICEFSPELKKQLLEGLYPYMRDEVFPGILTEHMDVVRAMDRFFDMVKDGFDNINTCTFKVDHGWKHVYNSIKPKNDSPSAINECEAQKIRLVAEYISSNFSERDVHYYLKQHDPDFYNRLLLEARDAVHLQVAHPEQVDQLSYAVERDRMLNLTEARTAL